MERKCKCRVCGEWFPAGRVKACAKNPGKHCREMTIQEVSAMMEADGADEEEGSDA